MTSPIRLVCSMATQGLLSELVPAWHARGGAPVALQSLGGVEAVNRVSAGEAIDAVVMAADAIDKLIAAGHVVPGSRRDLVRSVVAVAVRAGTPHPDIRDKAALLATLAATRRIGYSTGPSGVALLKVWEQWGLLDSLRDRLVQAKPGEPVGDLLVRGDVDLGFQQWSELMDRPGVEIAGVLPPGCEIITTFSAALCKACRRPDAVTPLLAFLQDPAHDAAKRRQGMTPHR